MRLIDADMGEQELERIYSAWCLAMAPAEGREIAYVDKQQRLVKLVLAFFRRLPTVEPPPNPPLTLEELREMVGEPVWVIIGDRGFYDIFCGTSTDGIAQFYKAALAEDDYGKTWLAYRRKPEETAI